MTDDEFADTAAAYMVWQVDCPCGDVCAYSDIHPEECESCGRPVVEDDA